MQEMVLEKSVLTEEDTQGFEKKNHEKIAKMIIRDIWQQVHQNVIWHEKSAIAEISSMYFILLHELTMWQARQKPESVIDCHAKNSAVKMYCA